MVKIIIWLHSLIETATYNSPRGGRCMLGREGDVAGILVLHADVIAVEL